MKKTDTMMTARATVLVCLVALSAPLAEAGRLVRVDLQHYTTNFGAFVGVETDAAALSAAFDTDATNTNFWNTPEVVGTPPAPGPYGLKDSTDPGGPDVAQFNVTAGTMRAYTYGYAPYHKAKEDYWFIPPNDTTPRTWEVTGLTPGATHEMVFYAGLHGLVNRALTVHVDTDGDGSLLDETPVTFGSSTVVESTLFPSVAVDGTGRIIGSWTNPATPDNFDAIIPGFQIAGPSDPVPEPAGLGLIGMALLALRRKRV